MKSDLNVEELRIAIALALKDAKGRPFAAFRGDHRKPLRRRAKPGQAGARRLVAMQISPSRSSSVAKIQRAERIFARSYDAISQRIKGGAA